ncbi:MAG: NAD(P)/FAD-dependent oxidoreductase [Sphingomonadales bacterium]|nr:NAD(P)/FAD-dependent oxidoreductase [Sphingomonadales bacterium]
MIETDICIIGAGPVGLFAVFEAGLLRMRCHLIDALPKVGGQLTEIYPRKPIYDIPGHPFVLAGDLVDRLMEQIAPFQPTFSLAQRVETIVREEDGSFLIGTSTGTQCRAKVVVIAAGLGCFEPRKPNLPQLARYEERGVRYMIIDPEVYRGKKVVIAGGGDSALDWTLILADLASELTLVHRNAEFRGIPDSTHKVKELARQGRIRLMLSSTLTELKGDPRLEAVVVTDASQQAHTLSADYLIPLYGLSPRLGPIADWGIRLEKHAIVVDTFDYSTSVEGIYAIGDINTYPGKLKLILCGFHEATLMCQSAFARVRPGEKLRFKYTTVQGINPF